MLYYILGYISYGFFEYSVHYLAHKFNNQRHNIHHLYPEYTKTYLITIKDVLDMTFLYFIISIINRTLLEFLIPNIICYHFYIYIHGLSHKKKIRNNWHLEHHKHKNKNFGVITSGWDWLFGTRLEKNGVNIFEFLPGFIYFW